MSFQNHSQHQHCYHRDNVEHIIIIGSYTHDYVIKYIDNTQMIIGSYSMPGACSASQHNTDATLRNLNKDYKFEYAEGGQIARYEIVKASFCCLVSKKAFDELFKLCTENASIYYKLEEMLIAKKLI